MEFLRAVSFIYTDNSVTFSLISIRYVNKLKSTSSLEKIDKFILNFDLVQQRKSIRR